jgi:competence ComEA-like helix-hairpin-helix protein
MFNQLKNSIRKYFGISRTETNGILFLILLLLLIILSPLMYRNIFKGGYYSYEADSIMLDSILQIFKQNVENDRLSQYMDQLPQDTVFLFDPNVVDYPQMILLGFDSIIARRIVKYRNNGGKFKIKKDLLKIYDFSEALYTKLETYICLPDTHRTSKLKNENTLNPPVNNNLQPKKIVMKININSADTNELKSVPGIGSVLSKRIIKYRELLGGYSNIDQLNDVYGLKGRSLANIKSCTYIDTLFTPEQIRVNFCDWKEFVKHPYIDSRLANDIIHLRSTKGFLERIDDLKEIPYLNDSILYHLNPYFEF